MKKPRRYVIGVDPSGNFKEGKGHTGLAVYDMVDDRIIETGYTYAADFNRFEDYYIATYNAIIDLYNKYKSEDYQEPVVSIEDYKLYGTKAKSQINSYLETPRIIGYLLTLFYESGIEYYIRPAVAVKTRWHEDILTKYGYIKKIGKSYWLRDEHTLLTHELDAIKHAVHCGKFEVK